jgi:hypothetical protein
MLYSLNTKAARRACLLGIRLAQAETYKVCPDYPHRGSCEECDLETVYPNNEQLVETIENLAPELLAIAEQASRDVAYQEKHGPRGKTSLGYDASYTRYMLRKTRGTYNEAGHRDRARELIAGMRRRYVDGHAAALAFLDRLVAARRANPAATSEQIAQEALRG